MKALTRSTVLISLLISQSVSALDGAEFASCLTSSLNRTIKSYRKVIDSYEVKEENSLRLREKMKKTITITAGDTNFLCNHLSHTDRENIKLTFVEVDEGTDHPYPESDIASIKIIDLKNAMSGQISCYQKQDSEVLIGKNEKLVDDAIELIFGKQFEDIKHSRVGDLSLKNCQLL